RPPGRRPQDLARLDTGARPRLRRRRRGRGGALVAARRPLRAGHAGDRRDPLPQPDRGGVRPARRARRARPAHGLPQGVGVLDHQDQRPTVRSRRGRLLRPGRRAPARRGGAGVSEMIVHDGYEEAAAAKLWALLPEVYRNDDSAVLDAPGPLQELLSRIAVQVATVRRSLDRLWDDQSIESCDDW